MQKTLTNLLQTIKNLPRKAIGCLGVAIFALPGLIGVMSARLWDWLSGSTSLFMVVFKRLRHNIGLAISAVVGIVAVLGMVVCVPVFSHAVSAKVLRSQLEERAYSSHRSLFSLHMYYMSQGSAQELSLADAQRVSDYIQSAFPALIGINVERVVTEVQSSALNWKPVAMQTAEVPKESWLQMGFVGIDTVPANGVLLEGQWPDLEASRNGPIQVAVMASTADEAFLNVGDRFTSNGVEIVIAGIWEPKNPTDTIWFALPSVSYSNMLWVPPQIFEERLAGVISRPIFYVSWYVMTSDEELKYAGAENYAKGLVRLDLELNRMLPGMITDYTPIEQLEAYQQRANSLTTLFYAVGGPMVILALLFIGLTATIAVQQYQQETATMRGRGTSWGQIVTLNVLESVLLILAAILPSILVGLGAASLMGQTLSFLKFADREPLALSLQGINGTWLLVASVAIILARLFPTLGISRTSIIRVKQEQSRATGKPFWQRFYLDFILLLPGIYSYVTMSGLAKPSNFIPRLQIEGAEQYRDPLLFVAPALFAMAVCMISLRILPWLLKVLTRLADHIPGVWAYLSVQQIARRPQDHSSALLLIMMSLSISIFSASTAKTLDKWLHDSIYYKSGADLVVHEYVVEGGSGSMFGPPSDPSSRPTISEADLNVEGYLTIEEHMKLPSIEGVARVGRYDTSFSYGAGEQRAILLGIDRQEFPDAAFYREDFTGQSLGALMNLLGMEPMGVLVPRTLAEEYGLQVSDRLNISAIILDQVVERELIIVGMYDYFPTIYPDGRTTLIINLEALFDNPDTAIGYDLWLNIREDTDVPLLLEQLKQLIGSPGAVVEVRGDALREVRKMMDEPERVGLFGVLNVGFLATGLMPGIGFVLYSYASLRRRFIQLGILQAIGLSVKQLIGYLALEQFILMGLAIGLGAVIGLVTSELFVPFLQISTETGTPIPPFEVLIGWAESAWLSLAFGLVLFMTMVGTIYYLAQMKVFQAVKMGEAA